MFVLMLENIFIARSFYSRVLCFLSKEGMENRLMFVIDTQLYHETI